MGILDRFFVGKNSDAVIADGELKDMPRTSSESSTEVPKLVVKLRLLNSVKTKEELFKNGDVNRGSQSEEYGIKGNMLSHLAVVKYGNASSGLFVSDKFVGQAAHIEVRDRLINKKITLVNERIVDVSVLLELNGALDAKKSDRSDTAGISDSDVSALVEEIQIAAIGVGASDIHLCCRQNSGKVLFRVNSLLEPYKQFPPSVCERIAGHYFTTLADQSSRSQNSFNIASKSFSCMIETIFKSTSYKLRFKFLKMNDGWDVVLRILEVESANRVKKTFPDLGYEASQIKKIELAVKRSIGLVALTGPTGSGKSTSLKVMMEFDPKGRFKKRYSIEDPVEYKIYGVSQISLQRSEHAGAIVQATFASHLSDILRADPNDVMVGETRDDETAMVVAHGVVTGHKIYTSVHTDSAIGTYLRLNLLGVQRHVLAGRQFIAVLMFQRLLPVLCQCCKKPAIGKYDDGSDCTTQEQKNYISEIFKIDLNSVYVANHNGCDKCRNGYTGSTVVAEVITPDNMMREYISKGQDAEAELYYRRTRRTEYSDPDMTGKLAYEHALYKMSQGLISPHDIEDEIDPFEVFETVPLVN